jgi:hypothetical protein
VKHHPHLGADRVRFSAADARRARAAIARQDAQERAYQRMWIEFKRRREAERATGGGIAMERRAA